MEELITQKRKLWARGNYHKFDPSPERIEDRRAIWLALHSNKQEIERIDDVIQHFRSKYEGKPWYGMSKVARRNLYIERRGRCCWCNNPLKMTEFTIEHIKPRSEGGTDEFENLNIACAKCNQDRGTNFLDKFGNFNEEFTKLNE